jgi:hypothetical protein
MTKNPAVFPDVSIGDPSFNSFVLLTDKLSPSIAISVTFVLLVFISIHVSIISRVPERLSSISQYQPYDNIEQGLVFGFALKHVDLSRDLIQLRCRFVNTGSDNGRFRISFNRTTRFLRNSSIVLLETNSFFINSRNIDLINERVDSDYDSVAFLFEFAEYSHQISGVELTWYYSNSECSLFVERMNRIFGSVTIYSFVCFVIAVSSEFRLETHLMTSFWFLLSILGFGYEDYGEKCFAGSVFLLKLRLWSLIKHPARGINFAIIIFLLEFLEFSRLRFLAGCAHLTYSLLFLWTAWPESRCMTGRDVLYRLIGGVSCAAGLLVYGLLPALRFFDNSIATQAMYGVTHWAIGLMVAFGEVPLQSKGSAPSRPFHNLGVI